MKPKISKDWLIGFTEGEGCWTWLGKWNNTTRDGKPVYYRRRQPQFLLAQKGRQVLDEVATFLMAKGVTTVGIWKKKKYDRCNDNENYELRVVGFQNAKIICNIFDGNLRIDYKRKQFESWRDEVMCHLKKWRDVHDDEIIGPAPERKVRKLPK